MPQITTLLRVFRILRIVRLLRGSEGMLNLLKALVFSLPQLLNVAAVLLLVWYIYAILGMSLFSGVKKGAFLNDDANFDSLLVTLLTLFRMATGESYNGIMHDCGVQPPYCEDGVNCGSPVLAAAYFVSFTLVSTFVLLNLLIAIIIDNFSDAVNLSASAISEEDVDECVPPAFPPRAPPLALAHAQRCPGSGGCGRSTTQKPTSTCPGYAWCARRVPKRAHPAAPPARAGATAEPHSGPQVPAGPEGPPCVRRSAHGAPVR